MQSKPAPVTFPPGALRPRAPTWPGGSHARGSRLCNWCVCCALPADVSRCVAERKYTQEQARKELQQVFIPECNDDGTYSQVRPLAPSGPRSVCSQLRGGGGRGCPWGPPCTAGKGGPGGAVTAGGGPGELTHSRPSRRKCPRRGRAAGRCPRALAWPSPSGRGAGPTDPGPSVGSSPSLPRLGRVREGAGRR